jgi:hypothetical protein
VGRIDNNRARLNAFIGRVQHPSNGTQERGLSGAAGPNQENVLTGLDDKGHILKHRLHARERAPRQVVHRDARPSAAGHALSNESTVDL